MKNVPFNHEVTTFVNSLLSHLSDDYAISCIHSHSVSLLISHKKFFINEKWHTWIDYEKFHDLISSGEKFDSLDYIAPTPDWAVFGNECEGFDPEETRVYRKKPDLNSQ